MYRVTSLSNFSRARQSCTVCLKCLKKQTESSVRRLGHPSMYRADARLSTKTTIGDTWIEPEGTRTGIHLYNSLTRRKDELILPKGNHLSWYICGPTVYDSSHIGHASNYVRYDIIRRILLNYFDINVTYMMGITDVDDKIINKANESGQEFTAITRYYEREFFHEMLCLNIMQPTMTSRVTDYVPEIIHFIKTIIDRGHAYRGSDGSVYFDVQKYGNYNKLQPYSEAQDAKAGVKRNVNDFALWKAVKPGEPYWASPWGDGRPGWHIECSAMASNVFGSSFDIHSGGIDLMFPHHENEIAQSCSYHDTCQWANYWMHTGYLHLQHDPEKMSKSLKNIIPTRELLHKFTANQFRMFCMLTHYRNNIEFTEDTMLQAVALDNKIGSFLRQCDAYVKGQIMGGEIHEAEIMQKVAETNEKVMSHLKDDFNTPEAMKCLFDLISMLNVGFSKSDTVCSRSPGVVAAVQVYVKRLCKKLGFHKKGWKMTQDPDNLRLKQVLDHTVRFRYKVREFALNEKLPNLESMSAKEQKKTRQQFFSTLMENCDDLRSELSHCNISIQDLKTSSSWEFDDANMSEESEWEDSDHEKSTQKKVKHKQKHSKKAEPTER